MVLWRRRPLLAVLVVPAVLQLGLTAYSVLLVPSGRIDNVAARTGTDLTANGWIDRAANGREVAYLANAQPPSADGEQRTMAFWNDAIRGGAYVAAAGLPPVPYPTIVMGAANLTVAPDGTVTPPLGRLVLQRPDSPFVQLAGKRLATSPDDRYEVVDPQDGLKARWLATGLTPDGVLAGDGALLLAGGDGAVEVTLRLAGIPNAATAVRLHLGDERRTIRFAAAPEPAQRDITLRACAPTPGTLRAARTAPAPDGRQVAAQVLAVTVRPTPRPCA
jgi:hypothetical protein